MGISISFRLLVDSLQFIVYSLQFTVAEPTLQNANE